MELNRTERKNVDHILENLKSPTAVITASDHLIDLPAHHNVFPEDLMAANKKQAKIKNLKVLYPKNGLYGLL